MQAALASSVDPRNKNASCLHVHLVLEEGMTAQYLSGHYVCEHINGDDGIIGRH